MDPKPEATKEWETLCAITLGHNQNLRNMMPEGSFEEADLRIDFDREVEGGLHGNRFR